MRGASTVWRGDCTDLYSETIQGGAFLPYSTLHSFVPSQFEVIPVAIIDGVIYISNHSKIHEHLLHHPEDNIMSALVLREFLYSL